VFDGNPEIDVLAIGDITEAANLEARATRSGWTSNNLAESMGAGNLCYKLLVNKKMRGYCVVRVVGTELEILNIVISKQFQGRGLGGFFLAGILNQKEFRETTEQWLEVRSGNLAAQALYHKTGFNVVGKRRGYYSRSGNPEDALIMKRSTRGL
jgi:ribosomal-protein-alanine N-acetyltransferase